MKEGGDQERESIYDSFLCVLNGNRERAVIIYTILNESKGIGKQFSKIERKLMKAGVKMRGRIRNNLQTLVNLNLVKKIKHPKFRLIVKLNTKNEYLKTFFEGLHKLIEEEMKEG